MVQSRIYGAILAPYKFPKFFTTRIFSLEYIRQILNVDAVNFTASKKKAQFKLRSQIGSFIIKNRDALKEVSNKLSVFKFQESFYWNYDPQGIISNLRIKNKLPRFLHESKPIIEKYANRLEWVANTLIDDDHNKKEDNLNST